ncbi:Hypothetical predicted protein [Octopus vulgaris]|uniref:Uncharacterized protein n=1 Tax=Octopus vulgaris TaxID=6645 RepID=A0AA36B2P9_OCTVU|nr:Hypothetical predicted protein [Octopus vulgaris]
MDGTPTTHAYVNYITGRWSVLLTDRGRDCMAKRGPMDIFIKPRHPVAEHDFDQMTAISPTLFHFTSFLLTLR